MGADDMNMMKGQETKSGSSVAVPLPYMDSNEINKRLDEHAKLLKEWEELLNRTNSPDVHSISHTDAQRHIYLKRKLHESLGVMARIVQNQIKIKKSGTDSQPNNIPPPVMVTSTSYQPTMTMPTGNPNSGMLLTPITYAPHQQQQPDQNGGLKQAPMTYSGSYPYNSGYIAALPSMPTQGGYNYTPNPSIPSQTHQQQPHLQQQQHQQQHQQQQQPQHQQQHQQQAPVQTPQQPMYIQQYPVNSPQIQAQGPGNATFQNIGYAPAYVAPTGYAANPQLQMQNPAGGTQYSTDPSGMRPTQPAQQGQQQMQQVPVQNQGQAYTPAYAVSPQFSNNSDGTANSVVYAQQVLSQVPTSYYGNTNVKSSGSSNNLAAAGNIAQQQKQQNQNHHHQQQQQQQGYSVEQTNQHQ